MPHKLLVDESTIDRHPLKEDLEAAGIEVVEKIYYYGGTSSIRFTGYNRHIGSKDGELPWCGFYWDDVYTVCPDCDGKPEIEVGETDGVSQYEKCRPCRGEGKIPYLVPKVSGNDNRCVALRICWSEKQADGSWKYNYAYVNQDDFEWPKDFKGVPFGETWQPRWVSCECEGGCSCGRWIGDLERADGMSYRLEDWAPGDERNHGPYPDDEELVALAYGPRFLKAFRTSKNAVDLKTAMEYLVQDLEKTALHQGY